MIRRFLIKILVSALAFWVADYLLVGVKVYGGYQGYLFAGLALGLLNTFVRPVLKLLALPLILVTLGFFTFVINAGILWAVAFALERVEITSILSLAWATVIVSVVHMIFESLTDKK